MREGKLSAAAARVELRRRARIKFPDSLRASSCDSDKVSGSLLLLLFLEAAENPDVKFTLAAFKCVAMFNKLSFYLYLSFSIARSLSLSLSLSLSCSLSLSQTSEARLSV